ncbi:MAG: hypothetical protein ACI4QA_06155 [Candidatus Spyradosoma sp.]
MASVPVSVLSGWGIAPEAVAPRFPAGTRVLAPTRENIALLAGAPRVVGYSLGAQLLLDAAARGEFSCPDVTLFAPFLAFPREAGAGGRVSATQVKFLRRWLKKDAPAALADFYARAGLSFPPPTDALPYRIEDLDTGLEFLATAKLAAVPAAARSWKIVLGEDDALIDARAAAATFAENPVRLVPAATHDLRTLL